jgi:hypothetical protein
VSLGGADPGEALAVLNLWHPDRAQWAPLVELLAEETAPPSMKRRALTVLAGRPESIPYDVGAELLAPLRRLTTTRVVRPAPFEGEPDLRGPALDLAVAIGAVDRGAAVGLLGDWLGNGAGPRRWVAQAAWRLGDPEHVGLLIALAADAEPTVRSTAGAALVMSLRGALMRRSSVAAAIDRAVGDPGIAVPEAVARAFASGGWKGEDAKRLRAELRLNISASVRLMAAESEEMAAEPTPSESSEAETEALDNPYRRQRLDELRREDPGESG